jgi:molybdopterin/thiamine biosynthesis adenylyltransferase
MKKVYCIGAGGTASYLIPVLVRMLSMNEDIDELIIIDRDTLEEKNLERQLYQPQGIGSSKVELLAEAVRIFTDVEVTAVNKWFTFDTDVEQGSFIISCTDNHPARLAVLKMCDEMDCEAVICGNETYAADAYYYRPDFQGTLRDPRVRYPEIETDKSDDPTRPPCNSEESLSDNPQLAAANSMSANLGMQLIQFYLFEVDKYNPEESMNIFPIEYSSHRTGIRALNYGAFEEK